MELENNDSIFVQFHSIAQYFHYIYPKTFQQLTKFTSIGTGGNSVI